VRFIVLDCLNHLIHEKSGHFCIPGNTKAAAARCSAVGVIVPAQHPQGDSAERRMEKSTVQTAQPARCANTKLHAR
jgi:hypothetical protein